MAGNPFAGSGRRYFRSKVKAELGADFPITGDMTTDTAGNVVVTVPVVTSSTSSLSGAGAVPITHSICEVTTTGADALTLADGVEGQNLVVTMIVDGGAGTLTPANPAGFATLTFDDVGDSAQLLFTNGTWVLLGGLATVA